MSGRRKSQRSSTLKRDHEEPIIITDSPTASPAKRQRNESKIPKTTLTISAAAMTTNVPDAVIRVYQQMLPNNSEGIAFLFGSRFSDALRVPAERVAIQYHVTKDDAIEELRRLLVIKAFTADEDATKISPTPLMDELWHAAILDTRLYADLQDALGVVLHHRPSGASEQETELRAKRLTAMKAMYSAFFSTDPLDYTPPPPSRPQLTGHPRNPITIFVMTPAGKTLSMTVDKRTTIDKVESALQRSEGIPVIEQRLLFNGNRLWDGNTLEDNNVDDEDTLELRVAQNGC
ncbi:uncharacterized protein PAC_10623 [Phialocephala subalpina]|uniref:Ubiquitin-like domain-containing protein n=1 Tax=Phialocephala subalpina TaxID=576137 RepID=A0A1L7X6S0_9HELO|nr:uncharacterized protein PAC_10623 [Phialocephala subalpina]